MKQEVKRGEVCLIIDKPIKQRINYDSSSIFMGKEYRFTKVLNLANQGSLQYMKKFVEFERIQDAHGHQTEGSCLCINGSDLDHRQFYFNIVIDYITQLLNYQALIKVDIFLQGINLIPFQIVEQNNQIQKTRLDFTGKGSSQQFLNIYNKIDQIAPLIQLLEKEMKLDSDTNVNITISQYDGFKISRKYSLIFVATNLIDLLQFWNTNINNPYSYIFNNTVGFKKSVVSFLDSFNNLNIQKYLKYMSLIQDQVIKDNNQSQEINFQVNDSLEVSQFQVKEQQQEFIQILKSKQKEQIENFIEEQSQHEIEQQIAVQNEMAQISSQNQSKKQLESDIVNQILYQLEEESHSETKILQVYANGPKVNVLDSKDYKKFQVSKTNYNGRLKLQLLDGVFDLMNTKIILRKQDCSKRDQQKKFKSLIETCVESNMNYFYMIVGQLPKKFFLENRKEKIDKQVQY